MASAAALGAWFVTITAFVLLGIWSGNGMSRVAGEITNLGSVMGVATGWYVWLQVRNGLSAT